MGELYSQYEYWIAAAQLLLAMLGMGATLRVRDFAEVVRAPWPITVGCLLQMIGVPLIAWLFLSVLSLEPGVAIGLALCAAIPGGTLSNVFTFLGRGHVALSIALTGVTTLACLVTTPIVLGFLISQHMPADFVMPAGQIAREITLILLLPLVIGMCVLSWLPNIAPRFSKYCIRGSLFFILVIIVGATASGRVDIPAFGVYNLAVVVAFLTLLASASFVLPRLGGLVNRDTTAINIEVTVRNGNLGLLIKASMFPAVVGATDPIGDAILFTVLIYGGLALLVGLGQVYLHRWLNRKTPISYPA
jgi:BASS family bile acid:Na+ symporter